MTDFLQYYEKNLYPFQNGVLTTVAKCATPLYLTGGTALSRGYYQHRYSDDLDFFVNADAHFSQYIATVLNALKTSGYEWKSAEQIVDIGFVSIYLRHKKYPVPLKVDFVNDISTHFGTVTKTSVYDRTDSVRNILSNKISALFRYEAKDVVDLVEICKHEPFFWTDVLKEAEEKEIGMTPQYLCDIISSMPKNEFDHIKWIYKPDWNDFQNNIRHIVDDVSQLRENSLKQQPPYTSA